MMVFISIVGLRPSSVAVTAKTIHKYTKEKYNIKEPIKSLLFATPKTKPASERLKEFFEVELNWPTRIALCNDSIIADRISETIKNLGSRPIFFNVSAGYSFAIAKIAGMTAELKANIYPVFAEARNLYLIESPNESPKRVFSALSQGFPLENLGLDWLLRLYGVRASYEKALEFNESKLFLEMKITLPDGKYSLQIPIACEIKGNLRVFTWLNEEDIPVNAKIKYQIDKLTGYTYAPDILNYLKPEFSFFTNSPKIKKELETRGFNVILVKHSVDASYILRELELKSNLVEIPSSWDKDTRTSSKSIRYRNISLSGQKSGLVVCLGSEPESTLLALATHKWDTAIVLLDSNSDRIMNMGNRLNEFFPGINLWHCSVYGSIDRESQLIETIQKGKWHCNISPGSKAQSWKLARIFPKHRLWSLETRTRKALRLFKSDQEPNFINFINVPIRVVAAMNGIYASEKITFNNLKEKLQFLQAMGSFLAEWKKEKNQIIVNEGWSSGKSVRLKNGKRLECTRIENDLIFFKLIMDGKTYEGSLQGPPNQGNWLEEIVAGAFILAGGNAVTDACVSLEFKWNDFNSGKNTRTELDVILRWREAYIAVSCKLGISENMITDVMWEIASEARDKLGRRAIPVLVSGHFDDQSEDPEKRALTSAEEGIALEISVSLLDKPEIIRQAVEKAIESKKTVFTGNN